MNEPTTRSSCAMRLVQIASLCLVATVAQAQTPPAMSSHSASMPKGQMQQGAMGSADMKQAMMKGMDGMQKTPMSGDTDMDFAMMMKMHHQQALDMAQMQLKHGKSPEMKAMARRIIAAQKKEIAEFDRWMTKHK